MSFHRAYASGALGTTSQSVRDLKNRVNGGVLAIDRQVDGCPQLDPATRAGWKAFLASWKVYMAADDSWFLGLGTGPLYDQGITYENQLVSWQQKINESSCTPTLPNLIPSDKPPSQQADMSDTVKTVAIGAGVVVGGIVLITLLKR